MPQRAQDSQAHELPQIVKAHRARVRRVLRARGVSERDVPDAEQEVFLVVHRKLGEFQGRSTIATWVHGIAINVASEHRRRACNRRESLAASEALLPSAMQSSDPQAQLEARDALARVRAALDALSAEQREAFLLHELSGLSMHEIAAQLEVPLKTVFSRFYAARRGIAATLARRGIAVSALWGWLALALPSRFVGRAHARIAQVPLASVALLCTVLPALSAPAIAPVSRAAIALAAPVRVVRRAQADAVSVPAPRAAALVHSAALALASAATPRADLRPQPQVRKTARASRRVAAVGAASVAVVPEIAIQTTEPDDDLVVTRAGAQDLRPIGEHPFAARFATYREPARIVLSGPPEAASALEERLAESRLP